MKKKLRWALLGLLILATCILLGRAVYALTAANTNIDKTLASFQLGKPVRLDRAMGCHHSDAGFVIAGFYCDASVTAYYKGPLEVEKVRQTLAAGGFAPEVKLYDGIDSSTGHRYRYIYIDCSTRGMIGVNVNYVPLEPAGNAADNRVSYPKALENQDVYRVVVSDSHDVVRWRP